MERGASADNAAQSQRIRLKSPRTGGEEGRGVEDNTYKRKAMWAAPAEQCAGKTGRL